MSSLSSGTDKNGTSDMEKQPLSSASSHHGSRHGATRQQQRRVGFSGTSRLTIACLFLAPLLIFSLWQSSRVSWQHFYGKVLLEEASVNLPSLATGHNGTRTTRTTQEQQQQPQPRDAAAASGQTSHNSVLGSIGKTVVGAVSGVEKLAQEAVQEVEKLAEAVVEDHHGDSETEPLVLPKEGKPLNLLLLYADDWTLKTLGLYNELLHTPHLDALAADGMAFVNNCVTTSICWISRASLVTGQYAATHRQVKISDEVLFAPAAWNQTLFPQLRQAGYYTGLVGKWHAPAPPQAMKEAFDLHRFYYGHHWFNRHGRRMHITDMNEEDGMDFLRTRPKDQPFALQVSFFATHAIDGEPFPLQFQPKNSSIEQWYRPNETTIPNAATNTEQHWQDLPWFFKPTNEGRKRWKDRFDTPERFDVSIRNLYRLASEVDAACGRLIEELKKQKVYDQTMIIFTTDNGYFQGDHGMSDKWYAFEESIKVPLIVYDPRMPREVRGQVNDEFTLNIDLAPTLLSAAQIPIPAPMQGRDISPLYRSPDAAAASWRKDFFYEWNQGGPSGEDHPIHHAHIPAVFALVEREFKYVYWPQTKYEQLFNWVQDPIEEYDILNATLQTNQELLDAMKARFSYLKGRAESGSRA